MTFLLLYWLLSKRIKNLHKTGYSRVGFIKNDLMKNALIERKTIFKN